MTGVKTHFTNSLDPEPHARIGVAVARHDWSRASRLPQWLTRKNVREGFNFATCS